MSRGPLDGETYDSKDPKTRQEANAAWFMTEGKIGRPFVTASSYARQKLKQGHTEGPQAHKYRLARVKSTGDDAVFYMEYVAKPPASAERLRPS